MVVLVLGLMLFFYFRSGKEAARQQVATAEPELPVLHEISSYELFCANNEDINCWQISGQDDHKQDGNSSEIILMDTGEMDEDLRQKISLIAGNGYNVDLQINGDMHNLLDKLYEEELPYDVIDESLKEEKPHLKEVTFVPPHKPAYWGKEPKVVIVIDDMGISKKRTADIISLHYPLTVAFLTYGNNLEEQIAAAKKSGHEIMLHTPMEASSNIDAAPDVLTTKMSLEEVGANFEKMLEKFSGIKGINNHMGSKLTEDFERMRVIMKILKKRGMFFLDSKTSAKSRAEEAAEAEGIAYAHRHVFLDNNNDKTYILGQLKKVEGLARKNGYAIAIGHPKTATYAALQEWLPGLSGKGIRLIHMSDAIKVLHPSFDKK